MKVLNINIFYKEGSTGKLVERIHQYLLSKGHDSYIVYGRGKRIWTKEEPKRIMKISIELFSRLNFYFTRILGLRFFTSFIETEYLILLIKRLKPDIVHLHCMNCNYVNPYILLNYLSKHGIKTVVTNHADIVFTANCDHAYDCERWKSGCGKCPNLKDAVHPFFFDNTALSWRMMYSSFSKFNRLWVTSVSSWTNSRAKQSPFFKKASFSTILNGVDTTIFHNWLSKVPLTMPAGHDKPIVLHVTPDFSSPIKGGKYVIELARRLPSYTFIVVGFNHSDEPLPNNIVTIKHTQNQIELAQYYSIAAVTLLPSKRETFSMVCAESLCCGTPVVGFKCGGPEEISIPEYSEFVQYDDINMLETIVKKWVGMSIPKKVVSSKALELYSSEIMCEKYLKLYTEISKID